MRFGCIASACLCVLSVFSHAQSTSDPHAVALLAQCRQAMGDAPAAFSIQGSGSIQDAAVKDQAGVSLTFRNTGPLFAIWTETAAGKTVVRQWARGRSRIVWPDGKHTPMGVSDSIYRVPELIPSYACQLSAAVQFSAIQYVGVEQKAGQSVDHIRIRMDDGQFAKLNEGIRKDIQSFDLYLASDTHQVVSISRYLVSPQTLQNRQIMEFDYSSYQQVAGVLIPQRISRTLGKQPYDVITISSVNEASALTAGDFQ